MEIPIVGWDPFSDLVQFGDEIKASYKNGVLVVTVPKAKVKKAKKVEIADQ